jgi:hypothetical protein
MLYGTNQLKDFEQMDFENVGPIGLGPPLLYAFPLMLNRIDKNLCGGRYKRTSLFERLISQKCTEGKNLKISIPCKCLEMETKIIRSS